MVEQRIATRPQGNNANAKPVPEDRSTEERPGPTVFFGASQRAFGAPGAGGSFAFADPDAHLGYAYLMNKLDFYLENDPREKALRDAVYQSMGRLTARTRAVEMVGASKHS